MIGDRSLDLFLNLFVDSIFDPGLRMSAISDLVSLRYGDKWVLATLKGAVDLTRNQTDAFSRIYGFCFYLGWTNWIFVSLRKFKAGWYILLFCLIFCPLSRALQTATIGLSCCTMYTPTRTALLF